MTEQKERIPPCALDLQQDCQTDCPVRPIMEAIIERNARNRKISFEQSVIFLRSLRLPGFAKTHASITGVELIQSLGPEAKCKNEEMGLLSVGGKDM